jgi:hypothetical protein
VARKLSILVYYWNKLCKFVLSIITITIIRIEKEYYEKNNLDINNDGSLPHRLQPAQQQDLGADPRLEYQAAGQECVAGQGISV